MSLSSTQKHRLKKIVVPIALMVICFCVLSWRTSSSITAQGDTLMPTPTVTVTEVPVYSDSDESYFILTSPIFIAALWPLAFVLLTFFLNRLLSSGNNSAGERKFEVKFEYIKGPPSSSAPDTIDVTNAQRTGSDSEIYAIYPLSINDLKEILNDTNKKVTDIEILIPRGIKSFNVAIDLCVGTIAADLSAIFSISTSNFAIASPENIRAITTTILMHVIITLLVAIIVRFSDASRSYFWSTVAVFMANLIGLAALWSSFQILGFLLN